ncbi:hypothetical protein BC941DRAFT_490406 [Chlamydoabsidia padenii]|nr:hypothetical protein BC941DRAFT_490406 [Chlamydoabsidia padenii]
MFRSLSLIKSSRHYALHYTTRATINDGGSHLASKPNVWVVTDGGIESTLQAVTVGKRLGQYSVKTITSNQFIRALPMVLQKYIVDWGTKRNQTKGLTALPWYLEGETDLQLQIFLGFTNLPFIHFDQVVIPKYEANVKMAKLGPLVIQKNCIVTEVPLLDNSLLALTRKRDTTVVVIGGHTSQCRWYSEDAVNLVHNMKKMVTQLHSNLLVIYTEKTPLSIKQIVTNTINKSIPDHNTKVVTWDATQDELTSLERIETYDNLIHQASRVILTADLDYATAHATMKR